MTGALTPRAFTMVTIPSHHRQWSRVSFKIRGEEVCFYFDLLKIEIAW
jgi:hypothetical protein